MRCFDLSSETSSLSNISNSCCTKRFQSQYGAIEFSLGALGRHQTSKKSIGTINSSLVCKQLPHWPGPESISGKMPLLTRYSNLNKLEANILNFTCHIRWQRDTLVVIWTQDRWICYKSKWNANLEVWHWLGLRKAFPLCTSEDLL